MLNKGPSTVTWIRIFLLLLVLASLYEPVVWSFSLPPDWFSVVLVAAFTLPALPPLLCALFARTRSRLVFGGVLLTCTSFLLLVPLFPGPFLHPHQGLQLLASAATLGLLLPRTRSFYMPQRPPGASGPARR